MRKIVIGTVATILLLVATASILGVAAASDDARRSFTAPMYSKTHSQAGGILCAPKLSHRWQINPRELKVLEICR
ncbi:hypothetical protein ACNJYD_02760 [Bradyrhizobium sp. DASA03005]|uniref:hypothetical protein n=1 Tax=Bradyrhizobium sp. SPXBL-02 TaxID=3395912 RepID=UPI003F71DDAB